MKLHFYTSNKFKFRVAESILKSYGIEVLMIKPEFREIQAEKSEDKVIDALNNATLEPSMAEDSGLYITQLKGFPGAITGYVQRTLTPEVFLRLIDEEVEASLVSVAGVKIEGKIELFRGEVKGRVIPEQRGYSDYWIDTIFIPYGRDITIAEMGIKKFIPISDWNISFRKVGDYLRRKIK